MAEESAGWILSITNSSEEIAEKTRNIYRQMLEGDPHVAAGNFNSISSAFLPRLFKLYDALFFAGKLEQLIDRSNVKNFILRFSKRLLKAGGVTKCRKHDLGEPNPPELEFSIFISAPLLFQTFQDVERTIVVNGLTCHDRLEALQRVFEHELVHLAEFLVWGQSSCKQPRFRKIAQNVFGHTAVTHQLVTQTERAREVFAVKIGDWVSFEFEGESRTGVLNHIAKRATVLVENDSGALYSNGKKYLKYYIPLSFLQKVEKR